jgi:gamma-glutamylputrescine oxidase
MNLLHVNDRAGEYPNSWYAATADFLSVQDPLDQDVQADVCVVGAGFTGLSAALHLAELGHKVVVLEAQRVGFGASGRNGGQINSGQRSDQHELEKALGFDKAKQLWDLSEDAKALVASLINKHNIDCYLRPGIAHFGLNKREMNDLHNEAEHLATHYGYDNLQVLNKDDGYELCKSPKYHGGYLDMGAAHLHPLRYAIGLATAAITAGVTIHEQSEVTRIDRGVKPKVHTATGSVTCDYVVLAANGYVGNLVPEVARRVMPINNYIAATEPLGDLADDVLSRDVAVGDTKFVINYFRLSHDKRMLFGGTESYRYKFPSDIAGNVRKPMSQIFPQLADVKIDYAWGGTLGITMQRMPYLARITPNIINASGYSGHGVAAATHAGQLTALAINGRSEGFDLQGSVPIAPFPGGMSMRYPLLVLAMSWFSLRDRIGF